MTRAFLLLAAVPALALGGCMGTQNRGLESVHQPVVARHDLALDLATQGDALAPGEQQRLAGWFGSIRLGYGDRVSVDSGSDDYARGARSDVGAIVARAGLLLSDDTPVTGAPVTPQTVRVVVSRLSAGVPGCPDWSRDASHEFEGNTSSNYGCAINTNLAAMVANPSDLVSGRGSAGGNDQRTSYRAIDAYRKAVPTGNGGGPVQGTGVTGGSK